ncbi:hypothetical protein B296_00002272 [Ensete ventricosum]|uniref:PAS domain-containing protein n=1 Tax=Ensete ventricosum TaxID=4639 RepID=A0A427AS97_ENSVE|nr:hypothetical protein B296_00002272 [Ensete ventricosum]
MFKDSGVSTSSCFKIFASDSFLELTEYTREEILGRNCRYIKTIPSSLNLQLLSNYLFNINFPISIKFSPTSNVYYRFLQGPETDQGTVAKIREAIREQREVTVQLINYTKSGKFVAVL